MIEEAELLGLRAHGPACGQAVLKAAAEDFQVDELLDIELSGQGEHLWLWVEKRDLNTEAAARRLARAAGLSQRAISYAGLKDRQALTRQWFSLHLPGKADPDLSGAEGYGLAILKAVRHARKLQRGAHAANGFHLRLRQLQADADLLETRLQQLRVQGVPNYFGLQRFGHQGGNLLQARRWAEAGEYPGQRNLRSRLLSAARSYLFNRQLAERVAAGSWNRAQPGDLLAFTDSRSFFAAGEAECQDPRLTLLDLHPTAALWGAGPSPAAGASGGLENRLASEQATLAKWLAGAGLAQERRILRLPIGRLTWHYPRPDQLELAFILPAGCFATLVVRELLDLLPAGTTDTACEF